MKKVVQLGFDVEVNENISNTELEMLYDTLVENINNFYDINGKPQGIKSIGEFSIEDITEQYEKNLGWNSVN